MRGEGEGEGETVEVAEPFSLVFPTPRRVADFLAWVVHEGPQVAWEADDEGEGAAYEPKVRLLWRMDLSRFIPLMA